MNFLSILSIFIIVSLTQCAPGVTDCTTEDLKECTKFEKKLDLYMGNFKGHRLPPAVYDNSTIVCKDLKACYAGLKCKPSADKIEDYGIKCSKLEYLTSSIHVCLPRFFNAVYEKKLECSKKFDFLTRDLTKKAKIYQEGKACFLEIAKEVCPPESLEYLNDNEKYNKLVNILTVKPDNKCKGPHHEFSAAQCRPSANKLDGMKIDLDTVKLNDPTLLAAIAQCKEVRECIKDACAYPMPHEIHHSCEGLQIANTPFGRCLPKLKTADSSKYPCVKQVNWSDLKGRCSKENDGKCAKIVMEGECGKDVLDNFQKNFDDSKRIACHRLF